MTSSYILGIDIGTGSVKAVAVEETGEIIYQNQIFYFNEQAGNEYEQDVVCMFSFLQKIIATVTTFLKKSPQLISLSSAMHSILAVDENGNPLTKAILWSDKRSSATAEELRSSELGKQIYEATGAPIHAMLPLCKIKWLAENDKAVFKQAFKFISIKEFIWYQLFKEYKIDYSIASATGLFNIHTLNWDEKALNVASITSEKLSAPVSTSYQQKIFDHNLIDTLNLSGETIFCIGASDGCLANLGSQCFDTSEAAITIGTSGAVRVTASKPLMDYEQMIFNYILDEKNFVCGGAVNNGGNVLAWVIEKLFKKDGSEENYSQTIAAIEKIPAGSKGLLFLPYLHGERAPVWDEKSSGAFLGVQAFHTQDYFARAAVEGVCFNLKEIFSSLELKMGKIEKVKISGGWTKELPLMQLLSDVLNKKLFLQNKADASALGAAYLGLQTLNLKFDLTTMVQPSHCIFPDQKNAEQYENLFSVYKSIYPILKSTMHSLHQYH